MKGKAYLLVVSKRKHLRYSLILTSLLVIAAEYYLFVHAPEALLNSSPSNFFSVFVAIPFVGLICLILFYYGFIIKRKALKIQGGWLYLGIIKHAQIQNVKSVERTTNKFGINAMSIIHINGKENLSISPIFKFSKSHWKNYNEFLRELEKAVFMANHTNGNTSDSKHALSS